MMIGTSLESRPPSGVTVPPSVEFLDAAKAEDRTRWLKIWSAWPRREVMAHPDYVRLFARPEDRTIAATLRTERGGILYPVIVRPLAAEPWAPQDARGCDLTTACGYGGPFAWAVTPAESTWFWSRFDQWAMTQGAVTSFARLSLFSEDRLPFPGETVNAGPHIVVRVDVGDEALWNSYRGEARRGIALAREKNVSVEFDPTGDRLDDFLKIYTLTMDRGYYFPRSFFETFIQSLRGHFTFVHAIVNKKVVSSEIVLLSADRAYSYLGGTLAEALPVSPNFLIKHASFLWCRDQGKKAVVLGGGYQPNDGILRYKQRFTHDPEVGFMLGRNTYDAGESRRLVARRRQWEREQGRVWSPAAEYFPEYRS